MINVEMTARIVEDGRRRVIHRETQVFPGKITKTSLQTITDTYVNETENQMSECPPSFTWYTFRKECGTYQVRIKGEYFDGDRINVCLNVKEVSK